MLLQQYSMKLRTKKGEKEKNIQIQKLDFWKRYSKFDKIPVRLTKIKWKKTYFISYMKEEA